ncbi:gluconolaconase [Scleromatobacter humisilvae]|uniref:Gluconolaconase n=1 Tax=Scleromatobacter humisilvae TaxID=2897159 RepID=A0A9X1YM81_9BURK|nr:gluconolaconase [Scleromatobacter humisilvae]MCK9688571.1 gluconolaconase [Scleromatobacter humisilvae]
MKRRKNNTNRRMALGGALAAIGVAAWIAVRHLGAPATSPSPAAPAPPSHDWPTHVQPLAGDGRVGWRDGAAAQARFADPYGLALDPHGTLYISDGGDNDRIRMLRPDGSVATLAGGVEGFQDGQGAAARFDTPSGLALDATGNLYVADTGNHAIRKVTPDGVVTTLAGNGKPGYRDGPGAQAQFDGPMGLAVDAAGRVIVADAYNDRIRAIAPDGTVTTLAGGATFGDADGPGAQARFDTPCAVLVDRTGRLLVADTRNDALRAIDAAGNVTTVARGLPGKAFEKALHRPVSLAQAKDGALVVGTLAGGLSEIAADGTPHALFGLDEPGLVRPTGLAVGLQRRLLVADAASSRLHLLTPAGDAAATRVDGAIGPAPDRPLPDAGGRWPVRPQLAWHEVVGTIGEDRGDGKGESRDHFHDGLDVRGDVGQEVVAIVAGKVSNPLATYGFGQINEGLSIGPLAYVHMHVGRGAHGAAIDPARFVPVHDEAGKLARMRVRRGARFAVGDVLGTINQMAHVHLWMGVSGHGLNPLALGLHGFVDTVAPSIGSIEIRDAAGTRFVKRDAGRLLVPRGNVELVVDAWDQVDGNLPRRRLGLYSLGVQWLRADGTPVPGFEQARTAIEFARLPGDERVKDVYADMSGITVQGSSETHFRYRVGRAEGDAPLPPGDYTLRIVAKDFSGNEATRGRDVAVRVF